MAQGFDKWSTTAASNSTADATINWAEGQSPSSVNDSARAMMARAAEYRDYTSGKTATGGSADAYTFASGDSGNVSLSDGFKIAFNCHATNTGASTINVDSLGAKPLRFFTGVALPAGALVLGSIYTATYDSGGDEWLLHGSANLLNASGQILAANGSAATPSFAFGSDTNTGVFRKGADNIGIAVNGTEVGDWDVNGLAVVGDVTVGDDLTVTDDASIGGDLAVTGNTTFTGTVSVTGGDLEPIYGIQTLQAVDATPYTANASLATVFPFDDTVPTITEGNEILTAAITPAATANKIEINVGGFGVPIGSNSFMIIALYRGNTCIFTSLRSGNTIPTSIDLTYVDSPNTTSATTYSVRVGSQTGSVVYMNGNNGGRLFGGSAACTMRLKELKTIA